MRYIGSAALSIFLIQLFCVSSATSNPSAIDNFLQCLPTHSNNATHPISETTYTPKNSSFQSVLEAYIKNRRFLSPATSKPLAIVAAKDKSHVQATILCAKSHGLQIRIRSGGHDYEGLSYTSQVPFVILDMFNLRSIQIDIAEEIAYVEAGATLGELYYSIANKSNVHAFPAGVCVTLGTGGHFSGGGYGNLMRKYGLSVDNIIDAEIVDANGRILNRETMGDLFWAIRGGGGASFGVILSWKIKLVRVPPKITVFRVSRTLEQGGTDIIYKWQQVAHALPKNLFIRAMPKIANGSFVDGKTIDIAFIGQFLGQTPKLLSLINKRFPELGLKQDDCKEVRWIESTIFWAEYPNGTSIDVLLNRPAGAPILFKSKSDFVKKVIPKEGLETIWKLMIKVGRNWMQWNPTGGKMNEISETATPYPHRAGYLFKIQYFTLWTENAGIETEKQINAFREIYAAMAPYVTKKPREAFLNYRDLDIGSNPSNETDFKSASVYGLKYYKNNFLRLAEVKSKFDPGNFFKNEQSIPVLHACKGSP